MIVSIETTTYHGKCTHGVATAIDLPGPSKGRNVRKQHTRSSVYLDPNYAERRSHPPPRLRGLEIWLRKLSKKCARGARPLAAEEDQENRSQFCQLSAPNVTFVPSCRGLTRSRLDQLRCACLCLHLGRLVRLSRLSLRACIEALASDLLQKCTPNCRRTLRLTL